MLSQPELIGLIKFCLVRGEWLIMQEEWVMLVEAESDLEAAIISGLIGGARYPGSQGRQQPLYRCDAGYRWPGVRSYSNGAQAALRTGKSVVRRDRKRLVG